MSGMQRRVSHDTVRQASNFSDKKSNFSWRNKPSPLPPPPHPRSKLTFQEIAVIYLLFTWIQLFHQLPPTTATLLKYLSQFCICNAQCVDRVSASVCHVLSTQGSLNIKLRNKHRNRPQKLFEFSDRRVVAKEQVFFSKVSAGDRIG